MKADIFLYGAIGKVEDDRPAEVLLIDIVSQFKRAEQADTIHLHISSIGGVVNEARAIRDFIRNQKQTKTIVAIGEGLVASSATPIFLECDLRAAREDFQFMMHNPWGSVEGDADLIEWYAKEVRTIEKEYVSDYSEKLGINPETISDLMKVETTLSLEKCKELNIVNHVIAPETVMAVAKIEISKQSNKMDAETKTFFEQLKEDFKTLVADVKASFSHIKALTLMSKEGVELVFPGEAPAKDDRVAADNGTYTVEWDSKTWTVTIAEGVVTELVEVQPEPDTETVESLKAKNAALESELQSMKAIKDEVLALKAIVDKARKTPTQQPDITAPKFQEPKPDPIEARKQELREKAEKVKTFNLK